MVEGKVLNFIYQSPVLEDFSLHLATLDNKYFNKVLDFIYLSQALATFFTTFCWFVNGKVIFKLIEAIEQEMMQMLMQSVDVKLSKLFQMTGSVTWECNDNQLSITIPAKINFLLLTVKRICYITAIQSSNALYFSKDIIILWQFFFKHLTWYKHD